MASKGSWVPLEPNSAAGLAFVLPSEQPRGGLNAVSSLDNPAWAAHRGCGPGAQEMWQPQLATRVRGHSPLSTAGSLPVAGPLTTSGPLVCGRAFICGEASMAWPQSVGRPLYTPCSDPNVLSSFAPASPLGLQLSDPKHSRSLSALCLQPSVHNCALTSSLCTGVFFPSSL
jgi:hypothetical protein